MLAVIWPVHVCSAAKLAPQANRAVNVMRTNCSFIDSFLLCPVRCRFIHAVRTRRCLTQTPPRAHDWVFGWKVQWCGGLQPVTPRTATTRAKAARVEYNWIEACFAPSVVSRFVIVFISLLFSFFVGWSVASGSMYVVHFCLSVRRASRAESLPTRATRRFPGDLSSLAQNGHQDGHQAHEPRAPDSFAAAFRGSVAPTVSCMSSGFIWGFSRLRVQGLGGATLLGLVFFPRHTLHPRHPSHSAFSTMHAARSAAFRIDFNLC